MNVTGTLIILLSAAMHAGWNVLGKRHARSDSGFPAGLFWGALLLSPLAGFYYPLMSLIPASVWLLAGAAGFFQALYFSALAAAYRHGDLSLAYPVVRAIPVILVLVVSIVRGHGDQISGLAIVGFLIVAAASFFLPMRHPGRPHMRDYFNRMSVYALLAAFGTAGYSILDDQALRILRASDVLGSDATVPEISFLYLLLEAWSAALWMWGYIGIFRPADSGREPRARTFVTPIFMGLMIYATYGLVLVAMSHARDVSYVVAFRQASLPIGVILGITVLKERTGWIRPLATVLLTFGLVLISVG